MKIPSSFNVHFFLLIPLLHPYFLNASYGISADADIYVVYLDVWKGKVYVGIYIHYINIYSTYKVFRTQYQNEYYNKL